MADDVVMYPHSVWNAVAALIRFAGSRRDAHRLLDLLAVRLEATGVLPKENERGTF